MSDYNLPPGVTTADIEAQQESAEEWLVRELRDVGARANSLAMMVENRVAGDARDIQRQLLNLETPLAEMWSRDVLEEE